MFIKLVISVVLLATALTAHSTPIRAYFFGQIDAIDFYDDIDTKSVPFRTGEKISGWAEIDWGKVYEPIESDPPIYVDGVSYKLFIGGSKSVWKLENHGSLELWSDNFGVGLPRGFYDNTPQDSGLWPNTFIDDTSFVFNEVGGRFSFYHVVDASGGYYDINGTFLFTEEFVVVPESSSLFLLLIALVFLLIVRSKTSKQIQHHSS
jgi:hypothetical protein